MSRRLGPKTILDRVFWVILSLRDRVPAVSLKVFRYFIYFGLFGGLRKESRECLPKRMSQPLGSEVPILDMYPDHFGIGCSWVPTAQRGQGSREDQGPQWTSAEGARQAAIRYPKAA